MNRKPSTDTIPAIDPMMRAPHGLTTMSAAVPTATPPARVAFWMWTYGINTGLIHGVAPVNPNDKGSLPELIKKFPKFS